MPKAPFPLRLEAAQAMSQRLIDAKNMPRSTGWRKRLSGRRKRGESVRWEKWAQNFLCPMPSLFAQMCQQSWCSCLADKWEKIVQFELVVSSSARCFPDKWAAASGMAADLPEAVLRDWWPWFRQPLRHVFDWAGPALVLQLGSPWCSAPAGLLIFTFLTPSTSSEPFSLCSLAL